MNQDKAALLELHQQAHADEDAMAKALGLALPPCTTPGPARWRAYRALHTAAQQASPDIAAIWTRATDLRWQIAMSQRDRTRRMVARRHDADDLASEALPWLFHAAVVWDPARSSFSSFAGWWLRLGVQHAGRALRPGLPGASRDAQLRLIRHDRGQRAEDLADDRVAVAAIGRVRALAVYSLEAHLDGGHNLHDLLADADAVPVDEQADLSLRVAHLHAALATLDIARPRLAQVVRAKYGIGAAPANYATTAAELGISRERVRQLTEDAYTTLAMRLSRQRGGHQENL